MWKVIKKGFVMSRLMRPFATAVARRTRRAHKPVASTVKESLSTLTGHPEQSGVDPDMDDLVRKLAKTTLSEPLPPSVQISDQDMEQLQKLMPHKTQAAIMFDLTIIHGGDPDAYLAYANQWASSAKTPLSSRDSRVALYKIATDSAQMNKTNQLTHSDSGDLEADVSGPQSNSFSC